MAPGLRKLLLTPSTVGMLLALALALPLSMTADAKARGDKGIDQPTDTVMDTAIDPGLDRRRVEIPSIDSDDIELGVFTGILGIEDFGSQAVHGLRLAYHVTSALFMEAAYGRSTAGLTSYERLSGGARLLSDDERRLDYYSLSAGYDLLPGETFLGGLQAYPSAFTIIGGIGSTDFAGNQRFTLSVGTGYRLLLTDWLAVHLDMRDLIFDMDLLGENKTTHNIEIDAGVSGYF